LNSTPREKGKGAKEGGADPFVRREKGGTPGMNLSRRDRKTRRLKTFISFPGEGEGRLPSSDHSCGKRDEEGGRAQGREASRVNSR